MNNLIKKGRNIKYYRERLGLTQEVVAKYLGVKREMISYYETDERDIPVKYLQSLADLFGIELIDLIEKDPAISQANIAFAYRTKDISSKDLNGIAHFRKIVKNYVKLKKKVSQIKQ